MAPELREVRRFRREEEARVLRRGSRPPRWYAAYPFFGDRSRGIPDHLYDVTQELTLRVHTDRVRWSGGRLLVEGQASIKRLDERQSRIKVWIEGKGKSGKGKSRISLPARQDGARFVAEVEGVAPGRWSVHAEVSANGMRLSSLLGASPVSCPRAGGPGSGRRWAGTAVWWSWSSPISESPPTLGQEPAWRIPGGCRESRVDGRMSPCWKA